MKKIITLILVFTTTLLFSQVPNYVPTNGLVGWWPFTGNANDLSGYGNNGVVNGATLILDRFGNANSAYNFDGVNDYVITGNNGIPSNTTASISVWIKPLQNNGIAEYISLGSSTNTTWGVIAGTNWQGSPYQTMNYGRGCSGTGPSNLAIAPTLGVWQNIVYVSTGVGGICNIYVNGNSIGQTTNGNIGNCTSTNLYFGVDIFGPNYINCLLDDIGIWNRALTQQEITNLYNASLSTEDFAINTIDIYPNPTTTLLNFKSVIQVEKILIYNMLGQLVQLEKVNASEGTINIEKLVQGTYLVKVNDIDKGYTIIKN